MEFRELIASLEENGDLLRIKDCVDPEFELGALLKQAEDRGKACWFEKVKGSAFSAIGGLLTSPERHALAIGHSPQDLLPLEKYGALFESSKQSPLDAPIVNQGPVSQVVLTGDEVDLTSLPVPRFFSGDSHRFITAGLGIAMDPDSGIQNVGFYRQPIIDKNRFSLGASNNSNLMRIYRDAKTRKAKLPVAVVIGGPPAFIITAGARMPSAVSDIGVAGALRGKPISLVKCQTSDLLVPAEAEFVIEAVVDFSEEA